MGLKLGPLELQASVLTTRPPPFNIKMKNAFIYLTF